MIRLRVEAYVKCCKVVKKELPDSVNYCDNQFRKLFTFFATVLIKLLCLLQSILFLSAYAKIEYVSIRTYPSKNRIRTLRILEK